jgi:hypothetical protein
MLKVAALVLDLYDDDAGEVARSLPEDLHACKVAARDEVVTLPDRCFGLVMKSAGMVHRKFPVHTLDAFKVSKAYFEKTKGSLPQEAQKAAAKKFSEVEAYYANPDSEAAALGYNSVAYVDVSALRPMQKSAAPEKFWGITINGKNHFPLHTAGLVKEAAARFETSTDGLLPEQKFVYARNLLKRAAALQLELPAVGAVQRYGNDLVNLTALKIAIDQRRKNAVAGHELLDQLEEASGCPLHQGEIESGASFEYRQAKQASAQTISADQIIPILEQFDKLAGFGAIEYRKGLLDPYAACYKLSAFTGSALLVDGVDLSRITPDLLAQHFDPEFIKEFEANPVQVYQAVPIPMKNLLRQLAGENQGMKPAQRDVMASADSGDPLVQLNPAYANGITAYD